MLARLWSLLVVIVIAASARAQATPEATPPSAPEATPPSAPEATPPSAPAAPATPAGLRHVAIGLYATALPEIDIKAGTFTIDMYMWLSYRGDDTAEFFEIANGEILSKTLLERTSKDGLTYVCWRIKATMHQHFSLEDYPFDRQRLEIHFENGLLEQDALAFEPDLRSYERSGVARDRWGLRGDVEVPEYDIVGTEWFVARSTYETNFGSPFLDKDRSYYSRAVYAIDVARSFWPYCYKILIPLIVILAIAYLVFFLPPNEIQSASGLAMTALLTCVAMNLTVSSNLPEVGYLVASDKFFICTYGLIFVTLAETVWTFALASEGKLARANQVERVFRWFFPIAALCSFAVLGASALS